MTISLSRVVARTPERVAERAEFARKGRLSKGRPFSFSQRPKAEREERTRGKRALRQCVIGVRVRGQKGGGMKGGRVLSGHIVVMHKALYNSLHTFLGSRTHGSYRARGPPAICQIKEYSGFNATSFLSIYSRSKSFQVLRTDLRGLTSIARLHEKCGANRIQTGTAPKALWLPSETSLLRIIAAS